MSDCGPVCVREEAGIELYFSPIVDNDEWVCRNARPSDFAAKNRLKPSFVHTKHLQAGELSAWRIQDPSELTILAQKLNGKGLPVDNILATKAGAIRAARIDGQGDSRVLCVINNTIVDGEGNHDPQHITISPCRKLLESPSDLEVEMTDLKAQISLAFRSSGIALHSLGNP